MAIDFNSSSRYIQDLYADKNSLNLSNFINKLTSNKYGKLIAVLTQFTLKYFVKCFDIPDEQLSQKQKLIKEYILKWGSKSTSQKGFWGGVLGGLVGGIYIAGTSGRNFEMKTGLATLGGAAGGAILMGNTEMNFTDFFKIVYMAYTEYFISITGNIGMNDLRQDVYLSRNNPVVKDLNSIQHLYYWCFYAAIVYEEHNTILTLLPKVAHTSSVIEDYFEYYNRHSHTISQPIFFIFADHVSKSIIISIRGTSSTADTISDALGTVGKLSCKFTRFNENSDYLAHEGFFNAACNVLELVRPKLNEFIQKYGRHYNVKIVGHSYGAGVASIVAWALEKDRIDGLLKTDIHVKAIVFCCPPVFNESAVKETCGIIATVILGWDVVPCASANNCFKLTCGSNDINEKCYKSTDYYDVSIFCDSYVPGTIYWLTYDDITRESKGLHLISYNNDRLRNIILHERMDDDHSILNMYIYLLSLIEKK